MGFLGRRQTAEATQPRPAQIGDWIREATGSYPFLTRNDLLGLAGMRALLAVDTGLHTSTYLNEGRHSAAELSTAALHSMLRANIVGTGATALTCGAPRPDLTFAADWQLRYQAQEGNQTVITVAEVRTTDDLIRSGALMTQLRDAVIEALAKGIHLHLADGLPDLGDLVVNMPAAGGPRFPRTDSSPYGFDHLGGISDTITQPLDLPTEARDLVLSVLRGTHFRTSDGSGDVLAVASLAGGRPFDAGSVALRHAGDRDQLVVVFPDDITPTERQRSYRAALRLLALLARKLADSAPAVAETIRHHVESVDGKTNAAWMTEVRGPAIISKERAAARQAAGLWLPYWNRETAAPVVPVAAGKWYPVGMLVTARADINFVDAAVDAADWVGNFKRTWTRGMREATREQNRIFSARRCGLLSSADGKTVPFLRYTWQTDCRDHATTRTGGNQIWFWEVNARRRKDAAVVDGRASGLFLVTGWSHADGVLGYGENLLALQRAFAEVMQVRDGNAEIKTLYMAT